jgi:hypothetical protein
VALTRVVGVYDADGGLLGEARYVVGKVLGRSSCSLCDITHGHRLSAKPEWRDLLADLGVPFDVLHRNEAAGVPWAAHGALPCVMAEVDGAWVQVLGRDELDACQGDVARFAERLRAALA